MKNKTLAAIDIGTNTFRLLIAEVYPDAEQRHYSIKEILSERIITRLGEGIADTGLISKQAMTRSIEALKKFSIIISEQKVHKTSAVATSALRDAVNSDYFIQMAKEQACLDIKVISGNQEAEMTASGILSDMSVPETALMVDIGGGSTELIFHSTQKYPIVDSINLGVVYLAGRYMFNDPPLNEDLRHMEEEIMQRMTAPVDYFKKLLSKDTVFIGTAGTVTALAAMAQNLVKFEHNKIHKFTLTLNDVSRIFATMSAASSENRARLIPFELSRLDIIVPGTLILLKLMESLGFKKMSVSNHGLLEGILLDLCNKEHG